MLVPGRPACMLQGIIRGSAPHGDARLYQTRNTIPSITQYSLPCISRHNGHHHIEIQTWSTSVPLVEERIQEIRQARPKPIYRQDDRPRQPHQRRRLRLRRAQKQQTILHQTHPHPRRQRPLRTSFLPYSSKLTKPYHLHSSPKRLTAQRALARAGVGEWDEFGVGSDV